MAEGVLGLGGGGSAALNQDVIDKLKAAEKRAQVEPLEKDIENWDLETEKVEAIETKVLELLAAVRPFDLFNSTGNSFEQMVGSTTGDAVVFEANDTSGLNPGTVSVNVTQLAQKDVFQSSSFSDKTVQISGGNDSGDMIVLSQTSRPIYQTDTTTTSPSSDVVNAAGGTITLDGVDFTVTPTMTYSELNTLINADSNFTSQITNNRLSITNSDGTSTVTVTGALSTTLGLSVGEKYSTVGKTYDELATEINYNSNYSASVEQVGSDSFKFVLKSSDSGTDNAINISQIGVDLDLSDSFTSASTFVPGNTAANGSITVNGTTITADGKTYSDIVTEINNISGVSASFDANNKIVVNSTDGFSAVTITNDTSDLGLLDDSQTLKAQNLKADIDGVDYDISSNQIVTQGNLTITAVKAGSSTISMQRDTSTMLNSVQDIVDKYNELLDLINDEAFSADSPVEDISTLKTMMSSIKNMFFNSYGDNPDPKDDKNIFNYGLSLDKSGHLALNTAEFTDAISNNFDDLKELFVGVAETKGFGTSLKEYIDDLNSFGGLLSTYDENRTARKETLDLELTDATEKLDSKYQYLATQFASYGTAIAQMEASFGGLKMMIEQSVAGN